MITAYLREVENAGCIITAAGNKLKLHDPRGLKKEQIDLLKNNKYEILLILRQQEEASKYGWIVYPFGEAYEKQVSPNSLVYLFKDRDGTFTVWRGTWKDGRVPQTEKILTSHVEFEEAFKRANNYVSWFRKNVKNRR